MLPKKLFDPTLFLLLFPFIWTQELNEYQAFPNVDDICEEPFPCDYSQGAFQFPRFEVVGGNASRPCRFSYAISLQIPNPYDLEIPSFLHICGGTLIAPTLILTAAHCFGGSERSTSSYPDAVKVIAGEMYAALNPYCRHMKGFERVKVSNIYMHGSYKEGAEEGNDIAVVELSEQFPGYLGPYVNYKGAKDVVQESGYENFLSSVIGWGSVNQLDTRRSKYFTSVLAQQLGFVRYVDNDKCNAFVEGLSAQIDSETMLCFQDENVDSCQGDSGGPLVTTRNSINEKNFTFAQPAEDIQIGITSWGPDVTCGGGKILPGVYTHVANYVDWIDNIISAYNNDFVGSILGVDNGQLPEEVPQPTPTLPSASGSSVGRSVVDLIVSRILDFDLDFGRDQNDDTIDPCQLPLIVGFCNDVTGRFYYNQVTQQCETFNFNGCGGNENNFKSYRECQDTCVRNN